MEDIKYAFLETQPELYSSKPNQYMILNEDYGLYSKKDATIICDFLNKNMYRILSEKLTRLKK